MGTTFCEAGEMSKLYSNAQVVVGSVLKAFGGCKEWGGRRGGYFCVADGLDGTPLLIALIGTVSNGKLSKYMEFACEKARRLAFQLGHESSWESRDPEDEKWGGAIRVGEIILSFSGFPELADEAIMLGVGLMYARQRGLATLEEQINRIAACSSNPYWGSLRDYKNETLH